MSIVDSIRKQFVPITPEGYPFIGDFALVARRIVCFVKESQPVGAGERFGMIRFGSRLDVYLPEGTPSLVAVGQTTTAGETVLADLAGGDGSRAFRAG